MLQIASWLRAQVPADERDELDAMVGEIFPVYEVEEWKVWVEKWWHVDTKQSFSHSLRLESPEFEVCEPGEG